MIVLILLKLCMILLVATSHSFAASFNDFPCVLRQEIWSYLPTKQRHRIRALGHQASASDIEQMYLQECMRRRALYALALFIRNATDVVSPDAFKAYLVRHRVKELMGNASDWRSTDVKLLEKIVSEIALNRQLRYHEISQQWLDVFHRHLESRCSVLLGKSSLFQVLRNLLRSRSFDTTYWSRQLRSLFYLGMREMDRTSFKYNRYIRIALGELDYQLFLIESQQSSVGLCIADCWSALEDYRLIPDFMEREQLRKHESKSVYITETVMRGMHCINVCGTYLNTDALYMLVRYKGENVLDLMTLRDFHVPRSMAQAARSFVVDHGLAKRSEVRVHAFTTNNANIQVQEIVKNEALHKENNFNSSNPLRPQRRTSVRKISQTAQVNESRWHNENVSTMGGARCCNNCCSLM